MVAQRSGSVTLAGSSLVVWWWTAELGISTGASLVESEETFTVVGTRLVVEFAWCLREKDTGGELQFLCLRRSMRTIGFASGVGSACVCSG